MVKALRSKLDAKRKELSDFQAKYKIRIRVWVPLTSLSVKAVLEPLIQPAAMPAWFWLEQFFWGLMYDAECAGLYAETLFV